jgi:hypothetical protein
LLPVCAIDAYHPICTSLEEQANQENASLLLGVSACATVDKITEHDIDDFRYRVCPKLDEQGKLKQEMILVWYVLNAYCYEGNEIN